MKIENIIKTIKIKMEQISKDENVIVAIDGDCASGKTTLADELQKQLGCNVIHMDDFFLRPEQRTPERYNTPGGNVDYERFMEEVLKPLTKGEHFFYRPFDCSKGKLGEVVYVEPKKIAIVEGSYSCHPALLDNYDFKIFLSIDSKLQQERILKRNGEDALEMFVQKWIPFEKLYFEKCNTKEMCDMAFDVD